MAFPRSPASTVSSYTSSPTLSSCPSSAISTHSSNQAISPTGIWLVVPVGPLVDNNPALAATGAPEFIQRNNLQQQQQQHEEPLESAAEFPKQEINGWEHPDLCSPSQQLKNVSTSIKEINRWARSFSTGLKVNSNIRLLESVFSLVQVVTSTTPHPDHIVAMIRVHDALANLLLVLPKTIFPFLVQDFVPFVDELCPRSASLSARLGNTLHDLRRSIRSGLQVLEAMILNYTSEVVPQGGGIHEITKYLLNYIMSLLNNGSSLKIILVSGEQDGKVVMETLEEIVATLIFHLDIMLEKESHRYQDAGLKQLFLVNNVDFTLHQVLGSEIRDLLGDDWVSKRRDQLKNIISWFINISWEPVIYCFHAKSKKIPIFSRLPTLQIFNLEFEKAYWTQKTWKVENPVLRYKMRKSVSEKIVQAYSSYLENNKNKATKLMKYTPEDLEELLADVFEG